MINGSDGATISVDGGKGGALKIISPPPSFIMSPPTTIFSIAYGSNRTTLSVGIRTRSDRVYRSRRLMPWVAESGQHRCRSP
jgi:hypothetical protein